MTETANAQGRRVYTAVEVDAMRRYVNDMLWLGMAIGVDQGSEERLRTYILAGVEPDDLAAHSEPARKASLQYMADCAAGKNALREMVSRRFVDLTSPNLSELRSRLASATEDIDPLGR